MSRTLTPWTAFSLLLLLGGGAGAQDFALSTPGTATWETFATPGGSQTVFTITGDTVLDWDHLVLGAGSELVYHFVGGDTVTNFLNGTAAHLIAGSVTANGNLGFFSPDANLIVTGSIRAESVTLATLDVDPAAFASGQGFSLSGGSGRALSVLGSVEAVSGDVLIAGYKLDVLEEASIGASGRAMIAGGSEIQILAGGDRRLSQNSLLGTIFHAGQTRAPQIEVAAGADVTNNGLLGDGNSRVFIEVGESGRISNQSQGVIASDRILLGEYDARGTEIPVHEGDASAVITDASLKIPALVRPGGETVSERRRITHSAPMSASADAVRDRKQRASSTVKADRRTGLASSTSFFGGIMRGAAREKR